MRARVPRPTPDHPTTDSPSAPPRSSSAASPESPEMIPLHSVRKDASGSGSGGATSSAHELHLPPGAQHPHTPNITDFTVRIPGSIRKNTGELPPPRWRTPEFYAYYVAFILVVPMLVWWPMRLSQPSNQNWWLIEPRLSPGWMFGRKVDNSDVQYRSFRGNFWALVGLATVFTIPSHLARRIWPSGPARARFLALAGTALLVALHGVSAVKALVILIANYACAKAAKPPAIARIWPALAIIANMVILFVNEKADGYRFARLIPALAVLDNPKYGGLLPRWQIGFNITMLRIVSFVLDTHWRQPPPSSAPTEQRSRTASSLPEQEYNLTNYLAYTLYAPLYIAGPIMTFNDFAWQLNHPLTITRKERVSYAIRFAFCMLVMESILHTMYVVAIKNTEAWYGNGPADLSMIGFWNLVVVWLKLLIPWRFFRLWALLDGVDPPENMVRCVANNYSTLGFWRSWHRSYNLWVVRYIYIPIGGAKRVILATTLVFTFVALWHDLSFKLLAWGWLVSLFILPELIGRTLVPAKKYGQRWWYRHVAACGGVANILLMMSANLVGFVLGLDGMKHLMLELVSTAHGWAFTAFACACLFIGVQIMFEYREEEARQGIERRC